MKFEQKKYILDNLGKKSLKEIAKDLGLKERKVKKFLDANKDTLSVNFWHKKRFYIWIIGLFLIFSFALGIRLYRTIAKPETFREGFGGFGDSFAYQAIASNLYKGNGFSSIDYGDQFGEIENRPKLSHKPAITRGPAYPFFLFLIYKFFGIPQDQLSRETWRINWDRVRIAQCILDSISCLLVFFIVRIIYPSSLWAPLISSGIYSFCFYNIFYTKALLSEILTTFLVTLFILSSVIVLKKEKVIWFFWLGFIAGFIPLCRTEYLIFLPLYVLFLFIIKRQSLKNALKISIIFVAGAVLVILPWSMRNYLIFKKPIIIAFGGLGEGLYAGTIYHGRSSWRGWEEFPDDGTVEENEKRESEALHKVYFFTLRYGDISEIEKLEKAYNELFLKRFKRAPMRIFKNWLIKIPRLWYQNYIPKYGVKEAKGWFFIFYFIFAVYAFFTEKTQFKILMLSVVFLFVYLNLIFLSVEVEPRYCVALMPGIISLTGIGISKFILKGKGLIS